MGQSLSNLQPVAMSQFSRQVLLQHLEFVPARSQAVLLKQGAAEFPNRMMKISVKIDVSILVWLHIFKTFCTKTRFLKTTRRSEQRYLATGVDITKLRTRQYV